MTDAIDDMVIKFREVLTATERLDAVRMREYQENLLRPLLLHARKQVPFYESRLNAVFRGTDIDLSHWHDIPILTRVDVQKHFEALKARAVPPHLGSVTSGQTSGSTGRPVHYLKNQLSDVAGLAITDRLYRWWGMDGNRVLGYLTSRLMSVPPGGLMGSWRSGFPAGRHYRNNEWGDPRQLASWLSEKHVNYLCADAGMLKAIAPELSALEQRPRLELLLSQGCKLDASIRSVCQAGFQARVADTYGAKEVGHIAYECPTCGLLHICSEGMFVEILDEAGVAVPPGSRGRVVCTAFYNYAFPLVRYELGDYAVVAAPSAKCPVKLPVLSEIVGRFRNTFVRPDGAIIAPYLEVEKLQRLLSCQQFQVVQHSLHGIEVRYVPLGKADIDRTGLEQLVKAALWPTATVTPVAMEQIHRDGSGKYEDYISMVRRQDVPSL